jgi:hypothetical protein
MLKTYPRQLILRIVSAGAQEGSLLDHNLQFLPGAKKKSSSFIFLRFEREVFKLEEVIFDFLPFDHYAFLMPEGESSLLL